MKGKLFILSVVLQFLVILTIGQKYPIKHVVVLMEENRSFDHLLGGMKKGGEFGDVRVNGLTGQECNPKDINDSSKGQICVNQNAKDNCQYDPNHGHAATTERIYSCKYDTKSKSTEGNPCEAHAYNNGNPNMGGFVQSGIWNHHDGLNEMTMWPCEKVPIVTTLAKEFANFDNFFCSYPGSTWPNRCFLHSGTASGITDTGDKPQRGAFDQKTIFRQIEETAQNQKRDLTWKLYQEDQQNLFSMYLSDLQTPSSLEKIVSMDTFYEDAKNGQLPSYSVIEPRMVANESAKDRPSFGLSNWQHPTSSILEGERLMKNVYEALRNGPSWNETLFIITYDEHGGFYDHVSPPSEGVPNPDGLQNKYGFNYTRLGIRIPFLLISPWIEKNTLVSEPSPQQKPFETSQWELSSVIATVKKIFDLDGQLTKRTEWAATFDDLLLQRKEPRTDCLQKLPDLPKPNDEEFDRQMDLEVDEESHIYMNMLCYLNNQEDYCWDKNMKTHRELSPWISQMFESYRRTKYEESKFTPISK